MSLENALAEIWERSKPIVRGRLEACEQAAAALSAGTLDDTGRQAGLRAAHQLAGSLGTFGLEEGSDVARELEGLLDPRTADDPARAAALTARLRALLAPRL